MMFEKVNPSHPDKIADRIAGAIVDAAYEHEPNPKVAAEVLLGHGKCFIVAETSAHVSKAEVNRIVYRIAGPNVVADYTRVPQDSHLAYNQEDSVKCGDNGIFKGCLVTYEQERLSRLMRTLYGKYPHDGKAVVDGDTLILCQSNMAWHGGSIAGFEEPIVNPLGYWTGGTDVDAGATNRKLGSDMGDAVTGGGLHGKDLSKADVSVNIACHVLAQEHQQEVEACCAIGDEEIEFRFEDGTSASVPYREVVETARNYVNGKGGFEKLAEWGLV